MSEARKFPVQEWFDSIQGEGTYVGLPVRFIRFGGCDYGLKACPWCDSARASDSANRDKWPLMTEDEIVELINSTHRDIVLTGGNPLLYLKDLPKLKSFANRIHVETQGSRSLPWAVKHLVVSPKLDWISQDRTAYEDTVEFWKTLPNGSESIDVKFPCDTLDDLVNLIQYHGELTEFGVRNTPIATIRNDSTRSREWYANKCLEFYESIKDLQGPSILLVQPQVHVLIWGNKEGV